MRDYPMADLGRALTYEADEELAALARRTASDSWNDSLGISRGDWKRAHLAGHHAGAVKAALNEKMVADTKAAARAERAEKAATALKLPAGWSSRIDGSWVVLAGPRIDSLPARLRRLGGDWDAAAKAWRVPVAKASSIGRVLANACAHASSPDAEAKRDARRREECLRWLGYVEDKARAGYVYQRGVEELREQRVAEFPDLAARLDAALARARQRRREVAADREAERAARRAEWDRERRDLGRSKAQPKPRHLYPLSHAPALGVPVRHLDAVVVYTDRSASFLISEDHPSLYGSHLLGYEGEPGAHHYYRPATEAEAADLAAREQARDDTRRARAELDSRIRTLAEQIKAVGECPSGMHNLEGDRYADSQTIYGGGSWFVLDPTHIWWVENNGMDGDVWAHNNVRTGGAGAIGWRVPRTPELEATLQILMPKGSD